MTLILSYLVHSLGNYAMILSIETGLSDGLSDDKVAIPPTMVVNF